MKFRILVFFVFIFGIYSQRAFSVSELQRELFRASKDGFGFVLRGDAEDRHAVSSIDLPSKDKRVQVKLGLTRVNPLSKPTQWSKDFFVKDRHRPLTWSEAERCCASLKWSGQTWRLPTLNELGQFQKLGYDLILKHDQHPSYLAGNYTELFLRAGQFRYLWTQDRDPKLPEGLRLAFNPVTGIRVSHTMQKPLSVICVANWEVPVDSRLLAGNPLGETQQ